MDAATYRCADIVIDPVNRRFIRQQEERDLEPKVLSVILELLARPNQLLTRDQLLDAVWGHRHVTPSTLNRAIALARKAFGDDERSVFIQTVHGFGYRYVGPYMVLPSDTTAPEPMAQFKPPASARVPGRLEEIIGREGEFARIAKLLRTHRAVTLVGAGGMGKTQCALEFARQHAESFRDGVWFYDLAPLRRGVEWLELVATSLSISARNESELAARVAAEFSCREALLVLDNCDRISVEVGVLLVELLRQTHGLRVLSTSQQPLDFLGESIFRMPPLALPPPYIADLVEIAEAPAVALLLARVRTAQLGFELTAENAVTIVEICRRLDGMPLALELAAPRFAMLSADQVLERLDDRFKFLVGDVAGRDQRHRTLVSLIEWSYALLSAREQRLLCWLSAFVQGWTVEAAESIGKSLSLDRDELMDHLAGLVRKSLVVVDQTLDTPRYYLLESIRSFALDSLAKRGEASAAFTAHLDCMRSMAARVQRDMLSPRMSRCIAQLRTEHSNISLALNWAKRCGRYDEAIDIVASLLIYMKSYGAIIDGKGWCEVALSGCATEVSRTRARVLLARGIIEMHMAASDVESRPWLGQAWRMARETEDGWAAACAAGYGALDCANRGLLEDAEAFAADADLRSRQIGDDWLRGLTGLARGWIHIARLEHTHAMTALGSVRHLSHDLHQRHFIDTYIGLAQHAIGDGREAAASWHDSMCNALRIGHVRGAAGCIEGCAYLSAQRGELTAAVRFLRVAEAVRERTKSALFRFWLPHQAAAKAIVTDAFSPGELSSLQSSASAERYENVANEAFDTLRRLKSLSG